VLIHMGHRNLARLLVAIGTLFAVLSILSIWVGRQVLDTGQWTTTSSRLLEDPAVQTVLAGYLVDQLYANVDVTAEVRSALPPRAQALAGPAAGALRRGAEDLAQRALDRPRVQLAWERANRAAHEQLVRVVKGGGDVVSTDQGAVTLDLKTMLDEIAQRAGVGSRVVAKIPADAAQIQIMKSDELGLAQSVAKLLRPLAIALTVLMLACFGGAIALARGKRRETLRAAGFGLIFAGALALAVRSVSGGIVVDQLATTASVTPAAQAAWDIGTSYLAGVAWATIAYGAIVVAGAWLAGPTAVAVTLRRGMAPYLRDWRVTYGAVAAVVIVVLLWAPTEWTRRLLPAITLMLLLVAGVEALRRATARDFPDAQRGEMSWSPRGVREAVGRTRTRIAARRGGRPPADGRTAAAVADDAALGRLERLAELHTAGALDDDEFAAAKRRVLAPDLTSSSPPALAGEQRLPEGGTAS
jgi:putative oligomerization/nucleic acid binding protein